MPSAEERAREIDESALGVVQWHCSEEGGGPDVGVSLGLGEGRTLWAGEISKQRHAEAGDEAAALGDDFGWWLIMYEKQSAQVIAKCLNCYEARSMFDLIASALRTAEREAYERAAKCAEQVANDFLSPQYATPQPIGSIQERFACKTVANAIRSLIGGEKT